MTLDEDIELRLADWLEDGPLGAPDAPIAAALEHARTHPRQSSTVGRWRTLMSGTNMTQVGPRPHTGWLYAAAAAVVLVVVVAAGYGLIQSNNSGVGTGPVPVVTPPPSPTAIVITGTETCQAKSAGTTSTVAGVKQTRDQGIDCATTMTDPRLTGGGSVIWNSDEHPDGTYLAWGTRTITTAGGSWSGPYAITSTASATSMTFDAALTGFGEYAGLLFRAKVVSSPLATSITGEILPVPDAVSGHQTCDASGGTDTQVGDVTSTRGVVLTCVDNVTDSRVHGTSTIQASVDTQPDGSADVWGNLVITNAGGTWEGFWFGTVDPGYTTHHVEGMLHGTGDYAGLLLRVTVTGDDQSGYDLVTRVFAAE